jgi:hypothetical protein
MKTQIVAFGQFPAPGIVDYHLRAELGSLHNSLYFAAIPDPLPSTLCEEKIDRARLVPVAALNESIAARGRSPDFVSKHVTSEMFQTS